MEHVVRERNASNMRVLVIGGTTFIGPAVVRQLVNDGHEVALFNRGRTQVDLPEGVERIIGDRASIGEFREQFRSFRPDVALDMRAMSERDARQMVDAVSGIVSRVVAISSLDVFQAFGRLFGSEPGAPVDLPLTEASPLREKLFPYRGETPRADDDPHKWRDDYDKIKVERVVMGNPELPGTVLRLPMVYGPRDGQHRFRAFVRRMDDGRPAIPLAESYANWRSSWGYVDDIAAAIALATTDERAANRIYVLSETEHPTMAEIAHTLAAMIGWQGRIVIVPDSEMPPAMNVEQDLVADSSLIRDELDYGEVTPKEEALAQTIEWERQGGPPMDPSELDYASEDALLEKYG